MVNSQVNDAIDAICKIRSLLLDGGFECDQCSVDWSAAFVACNKALDETIMHGDEAPLDVLGRLAEKYYTYYLMNKDFEYSYMVLERIVDCLIK